MKSSIKLFFSILCICVVQLLAQPADAGRTPFGLLMINHGARDAGMAGASIAMPNDLAGFYANPATLGYITRRQALVGFRSFVLDIFGGMAGAAFPVDRFGVISVNVIDMNEGTVDEILEGSDGLPYETGRIWKTNGVSGGMSWSRIVWEKLSLGLSLRGFHHRMATRDEHFSTTGFGADIGVQYRLLAGRFITGAVARNLGFLFSNYATYLKDYPFPTGFGAGLSYVPYYVQAIRLALDIEQKRGEYTEIQPAIEISLLEQSLKLRLGYAFSSKDAEEGLKVLSGLPTTDYVKSSFNTLCLGMGISTANYGVPLDFDVALEFHTDIGPSVILSLLYSF